MMECSEALEWLDAAASGIDGEYAAWIKAAQRHVGTCAQCQSEQLQRTAWDDRLATAMASVAIPDGLAQQLSAAIARVTVPTEGKALSGVSQTTVSQVTVQTPIAVRRNQFRRNPSSARRVWLVGGLVVMALLGLGLVSRDWWQAPAAIELRELFAAADAHYFDLPPFQGRFEPRLPAVWSSVFTLDPKLTRGFPSEGPQAGRMAFIPFQMTIRDDGSLLRGRLLILKRSQLALAPAGLASDFGQAEVRYLPRSQGAFLVWEESELVFVCLMPSGPADLHKFQRALQRVPTLT